jgi:transposase
MSWPATQVLHPADTQELLQQLSTLASEHLWYSVHYNQQTDRQEKMKEIEREKKRNGDPDAVRYMFGKNLNALGELKKLPN